MTWTPDQLHVFHERLGIADDLGLDTSIGSVAWLVAVRAAEALAKPHESHTERPDPAP